MKNTLLRFAALSASALLLSSSLISVVTSSAQADVLTGKVSAPVLATFETADSANDFSTPKATTRSTLSFVAGPSTTDFGGDFDSGALTASVVDNKPTELSTPILTFDPVAGASLGESFSAWVYAPVGAESVTITLEGTKPGDPTFGQVGYSPYTASQTIDRSGLNEGYWSQVGAYFDNLEAGVRYNGFSIAVAYHTGKFETKYTGDAWYFDNVAFDGATKFIPRTNPSRVIGFEGSDLGNIDAGAGQVVTDAPTKGSFSSNKSLTLTRPSYCDDRTLVYTAQTGESVISAGSKIIYANVYSEYIGENAVMMLEYAPFQGIWSAFTPTTKLGWQTLAFDFSGARGFDPDLIYNKLLINPDMHGNDRCQSGAYFIDDIAFNGAQPASLEVAKSHAVTFDSKGGTTVAAGTFLEGASISTPAAPTRAGYTFGGWSATDGGVAVSLPYSPTSKADLTLFALWTPNTYAVTFDSKSGTSVAAGSFVTAGSIVAPSAPSRTGFTFGGWSATDGGVAVSFPYSPGVTSAVTLYARWAAIAGPVAKKVALSASSSKAAQISVTVQNAKGKTVKVAVAGGATVSKKATTDNFVITVSAKKGNQKVTVTVGTDKLVKTIKVG
jgi:uncharacterized repeat protein (TIGR02543 family)